MKATDQLKLLLDLAARVEVLENIIRSNEKLVYTKDEDDASGYTPPEEAGRYEPPPEQKKPPKKKKVPQFEISAIEFMSNTELVQMCHRLGHTNATRQIPRDDLISLILGEGIEVMDPLEEIRERTHQFVQGNKRLMRAVMSCDLNCPVCPHHQVVACYTANHQKVESL